MTQRQAETIWKLLLAAFPHQVMEAPTQALYLEHLRALPWREGRTEDAIRALIAGQDGAFMPPIGAVVAAAGVHGDAVPQLVAAMKRGTELAVDLGSLSGWAVAGEERIPLSVVKPLPELPEGATGDAFTSEQQAENQRRLRAITGDLRTRRSAS